MKRTAFLMVLVMPLIVTAAGLVYFQADLGEARPQSETARQTAPFRLVEIAGGFSTPIYLTHAGDRSGRLFIVEQSGKIWTWDTATELNNVYLDVSDLISPAALTGDYTERGLLGLAFHPDYAENGLFYINYTDHNGHTVIARYQVSADNPNQADPASATMLLYVQQPYPNHNGGHMAFGPDGYLYVSLGDGGSGGDPEGHGQNLGSLLGKILRLDINAEEGYAIPENNPFVGNEAARPEIWAWGLRNVWRFSFDRATGDLYLADVGQDAWEEINFQAAASAGGENYGWNAYEGTHTYSGASPASNAVMPILEYSHDGGCSVTGGYVYRGEEIPALQGDYLYSDWCTGTIWVARPDNNGSWSVAFSSESGRAVSSFGEDEAGELYLVDHNGSVLRFEPGSGN